MKVKDDLTFPYSYDKYGDDVDVLVENMESALEHQGHQWYVSEATCKRKAVPCGPERQRWTHHRQVEFASIQLGAPSECTKSDGWWHAIIVQHWEHPTAVHYGPRSVQHTELSSGGTAVLFGCDVCTDTCELSGSVQPTASSSSIHGQRTLLSAHRAGGTGAWVPNEWYADGTQVCQSPH
jgi:hypothetical protein